MMINIKKIDITKSILNSTFEFLQKYGQEDLESHALWVGQKTDTVFRVSDVWFPKQTNTPISYEVPEEEEFRINKKLNNESLILMCQIHTHPGDAFHSNTDDEGSALVLPGSLSIVIPDYGFIQKDDFSRWEVYIFDGTHWCRLRRKEVDELFQII